MTRKLFSRAGLLILAVSVLLLVLLVNNVVKNWRADLTEDNLYTLSDGTHNMLRNLQQPVKLELFFSNKLTKDLPRLRSYAKRVRELLEEYSLIAGDNLNFEVIDPEPFSESEDKAAEYGLQAVPTSLGGPEVYFGLAATGDSGNREVIEFFQLDKEEFLEYDISKLIYAASQKEKPKLALVAGLQVDGGFNPMTRQPSQPWVAVSQLDMLFNVERLGLDFNKINDDVDLLIVIHPKDISDDAQYAIDQFVLGGGNALIFVDPVASQDTGGGGMMAFGPKASNLEALFKAWGLTMTKDKVVGDAKHALSISQGQGQRPTRHLGIVGYGKDNFAKDEVVMADLEVINFATAGALAPIEGAVTTFTPLIQSSDEAMLIDASKFAFLQNPSTLFNDFKPTGEHYTVAARIQGPVKTAFPDGPPEKKEEEANPDDKESADSAGKTDGEEAVASSGNATADKATADDGAKAGEAKVEEVAKADANAAEVAKDQDAAEDKEEEVLFPDPLTASKGDINVVVIADTDVLGDPLWVSVRQFFGQTFAQPFAGNGDLFINSVDNMLGNADLISIRGRGQFSRPFDLVDAIEREAENKFREKERELQKQLEETESKLADLQASKDGEEKLTLSPEQKETLERFQAEKLRIRKDLREVQHQLGQDIEELGTLIKLLNILSIPLLLTLLLMGNHFIQRRRHLA
ncbi:Gldg family protein [Zooshikella marina]|uniref:GldG family protein n=1 Tax=Zooshikella ganghwensis TaxID=202772 RepID=UPI001BAFB194|nr:GldG family protein [Zooshikella ganghwensis]MBU2704787.1 Gldg family protein [Zooshikella ganghwensis]